MCIRRWTLICFTGTNPEDDVGNRDLTQDRRSTRATFVTRRWWNTVASEVVAIADGPAPRVPVWLAVGITCGAVAWGNAVVLVQRRVGGDAGELVTTVAHPMLGLAACAALLATGWRSADLGLVPPSRRALGRLRRPATVLALVAVGAAIATVVRGGIDDGVNARISILRLVIGTALGEELVHRGVLFPLWAATRRTPKLVVAANAVAFGAWHVASVAPTGWFGRLSGILGPATFGTALFLWGRSRSRSIVGPWLLHTMTNLPGLIAEMWAAKRA